MKYWYSRNLIAWLLWPLSLIFCVVVFVRRQCYQLGIVSSQHFDVPVVIVGNISVGGSGKTPLLIAICEFLIQQGKIPGIVSRGYGGSVNGVKQIDDNDSAINVGDEPWMIFQRTRCPVVVGANRAAAVSFLLDNNNCDIVLSDDGLQHYQLQRSLEIAVVDARHLHGNRFCLPAGPLREPVSRLENVDIIVYNGRPDHQPDAEKNCFYQLQFEQIVNLVSGEKKLIQALKNQPVIAVAGIGYPERFFRLLSDAGLIVQQQPFADHYIFTDGDIAAWSGKCVLMTEKDAVKCQYYLQQKQNTSATDFDITDFANLWYLPVTAICNNKLTQVLAKTLL